MAYFPQQSGLPDASSTIPPSLNTLPHLDSQAKLLHEDYDFQSFLSTLFGTPSQSGIQVQSPSDDDLRDPALNFDQGLLSPLTPTQPEKNTAFDDFYRENFEGVQHDNTSATTTAAGAHLSLLDSDAYDPSSTMLVGHKRRFDAIDSEHDMEDDAFATAFTTHSVTDATRSSNEFFSPPIGGQQNVFHYADASQPVPTVRAASADSRNVPAAGRSCDAFPIRPHSEPVRPLHHLYSTGPLVGGGTAPLVNNSTIIKPPSLLHPNLVPRDVSVQAGSNLVYPVGSSHVQHNSVPRYPNRPIHRNLHLIQDTNHHPSHTRLTSQQPTENLSYTLYQSQSQTITVGVPTFNPNALSIPPNLRFPLPNHQGTQQVPAFTFKVPDVPHRSMVPRSSLAAVAPAGSTTTNRPPISPPDATTPSTESDDDPQDGIVKVHTQQLNFACPFSGCQTTFTGIDATKGHIQTHFNTTHYRGLDLAGKVKCPFSNCPAVGQRLGRGRHVVEVHWRNRRYQCIRCDASFTRKSKAREHVSNGTCANKRQRRA